MKTINVYTLTKKEIIDRFTIEYCPSCDSEQIIFAHGTTKCPNCGHVLVPCSVCWNGDGGCFLHDDCPYKDTVEASDDARVATNIPIILDDNEKEFLYKNL